jgi:hypothetical protein
MYEMLAGGPLFGGSKEQQMLTRITDMLGPLRWEASGTIPAASCLKQCVLLLDLLVAASCSWCRCPQSVKWRGSMVKMIVVPAAPAFLRSPPQFKAGALES